MTYSDTSTGHIFLIQITIISDINIYSSACKFKAKNVSSIDRAHDSVLCGAHRGAIILKEGIPCAFARR